MTETTHENLLLTPLHPYLEHRSPACQTDCVCGLTIVVADLGDHLLATRQETGFTHAEFSRFVEEAKTQRERAEAAEKKAERWKQGFYAEAKARAAAEQQRDGYKAQLLAGEGVLVDAPALAVHERELREAAEKERANAEATAMTVAARLIDVEGERDAAKQAIEHAAAALTLALHDAEQLEERADRSERERAEAMLRLAAMMAERDAWGGKAATAQAEAGAFRAQRVQVVRVLSDLLDAVDRLTREAPTPYVARVVGSTALTARGLVDLYRRSAALAPPELVEAYQRDAEQMRHTPAFPEWVAVHIGELPGQNTFASCYRCGGLCQPETWTSSLTERIAMVEAFSSEHAQCPPIEPAPARCPHGHAGCCGHHDQEDMPIHADGECAGPDHVRIVSDRSGYHFEPVESATPAPSEEGQPT